MKSPELMTATAIAHPNIAFIKYWGNRDDALRLPCNSSLSSNLAGLETRTTVRFDPSYTEDCFSLAGEVQEDASLKRVSDFLYLVRSMAQRNIYAQVDSANNFLPVPELLHRPQPLPRWHLQPQPPLDYAFPKVSFPVLPGAVPAPPAVPSRTVLFSGKRGRATRTLSLTRSRQLTIGN